MSPGISHRRVNNSCHLPLCVFVSKKLDSIKPSIPSFFPLFYSHSLALLGKKVATIILKCNHFVVPAKRKRRNMFSIFFFLGKNKKQAVHTHTVHFI